MERRLAGLRSEPRFLKFEEVVALHVIAVFRDGGATELIDRGKLEAAIAAPKATFGGRLLNSTIEEQTAAYWHGICQAHAFLDGNKRLSLLCAYAFLRFNGLEMTLTDRQAGDLTIRIAKGKLSKADVARQLARKIRPRD